MDETGLIQAKTPFFCPSYGSGSNSNCNIQTNYQIKNNSPSNNRLVNTHGFRRPAGMSDFVLAGENPQKDNMDLFDPREYPEFSCNNQPPFSNRQFPLFHPHYYKGGYFNNSNYKINPEYPTQWAPSLEYIFSYPKKYNPNLYMNNRQYFPSEDDYASIIDNRMESHQSFAGCCNSVNKF